MLYIVALFCPPLALLFCGKPLQAFLNFGLYVVGIVLLFLTGIGGALGLIALVHAIIVIANDKAEARTDRIITAMKRYNVQPATMNQAVKKKIIIRSRKSA